MRHFLISVLLFLPLAAEAADVSVSGSVSLRQGNTAVNIGFSNRDRTVMAQYYREGAGRVVVQQEPADDDHPRKKKKKKKHGHDDDGDGRGLPPGLAKRGDNLPPGLKKKDRLPPGLAKRDRVPADVHYEPLPRDLERKLSPLPDRNMIRVRIGQDIVLMNRKTRVILDLQRDLAR